MNPTYRQIWRVSIHYRLSTVVKYMKWRTHTLGTKIYAAANYATSLNQFPTNREMKLSVARNGYKYQIKLQFEWAIMSLRFPSLANTCRIYLTTWYSDRYWHLTVECYEFSLLVLPLDLIHDISQGMTNSHSNQPNSLFQYNTRTLSDSD